MVRAPSGTDFGFDFLAAFAAVDVLGFGWVGDDATGVRFFACCDQVTFALIPGIEDFGAWSATEDAWVDETGESYARNTKRAVKIN
jgi:hypothetical protein